MSKQLTISATASVFAMALFAFSTSVSTSGGNAISSAPHNTGATTEAAAPALGQLIPAIGLIR